VTFQFHSGGGWESLAENASMNSHPRRAALYRMVTDKHVCPYGLKSLGLLRHEGFKVQDHLLRSRDEVDAFKQQQRVESTPQTFINGRRIGGYEDLLKYFGKRKRDPSAPTYKPVIAIFGMAAAMAFAANWAATGELFSDFAVRWFVALAMCLLAVQKLRDLDGFATMFLGYDLLARHWVSYAWVYPFAEALAGILMLAGGALQWVAIPIALFIGTVGFVSVFYAVYVQKRELKCACMGANSNVPLGFVSLTENLMMIAVVAWMLSSAIDIRGQAV
jgi:glutaredoxin